MNGVAVPKRTYLSTLPTLAGQQADASRPSSQVRLSASAGTGKTQVLTARVFRLLLNGVNPEAILCLTFTKAGAAEMADRIHERLGAWVTMDDKDIRKDLFALGEPHSDAGLIEARKLFAKVLDARGSGLRIQTIHSFCQTLLASFPAEAGLPTGFRPIEGREEDQLAAKALAQLVEGYERDGQAEPLNRLRRTAKQLSEDATRSFLRRCATDPDAMDVLPIGDGLGPFVQRAISGIDDIDVVLTPMCDEGGFDRTSLELLRSILEAWRTKAGAPYAEGEKSAGRIARWLVAEPAERAEMLTELRTAWRTAAGEWRKLEPVDPDYRPTAARLDGWIETLITLQRAARVAPKIIDALSVGREYARTFADAKRLAGIVDFNDLIRSTVRLLKTPGIGDWIKFKLDQQVDHILVDEAQDTNAAQWDIVKALAEEFFAGDGAKSPRGRTLFTVGDFKQAIFGFQGTDPHEFAVAGEYFAKLAAEAEQEMLPLSLSQSFRSSQPILDVTDALLSELGFATLGLPEMPEKHVSARGGSGSVTLLPPVNSVSGEDDDEEGDDRIGEAELKWAAALAEHVRDWTSGNLCLRNQDRPVEPGDVMILVRSRGELARMIVSQLHGVSVAVAGVDRLRLNAPIAVQDLLACIRFVLQPRDDLSLACILVSPLIGWTQEQLYDQSKGRNIGLWQHLGEDKPEELKIMLDRADRATPYQFLESILSDPLIEGRKRLIARLGEEARDPIEELLNAALSFETQAMPSLQLFLDWFDRGDVDIKRDPAKPENAVRVMTVHAAKGLQAPVVVLADAASDPNFKRKSELDWDVGEGRKIPLFRPKSAERVGSLRLSAEVQDAREMEEHWRLLYVAMTRAEEHLFVGGALKPKQQAKGMSDACWHVRVERALVALGASKKESGAIALVREERVGTRSKAEETVEHWTAPLPEWAISKAAQEQRPPRPLAPSALGVPDTEASPPPSDERRKAAQRGVWLHNLFERLPGVAVEDRRTAALRWLARVTDDITATELADLALSIINQPEFSEIFSPKALAEAPLAGVVEGDVIAGTVDRLLVTADEVLVVDFKTGRRVPNDADAVSGHHKAQMGAYVAVLQGIFPEKSVRAALLYTSGPSLITLTPEMLAAHKPGFSDANQEFAAAS